MDNRQRISSGSPFEPRIGFSRALRVGNRALVSGTAPVWPDGSCDPDPSVQARRCFEIILAALLEAGAEARHVVRTRMFIVDAADAESVGSAHGEVFGDVRVRVDGLFQKSDGLRSAPVFAIQAAQPDE